MKLAATLKLELATTETEFTPQVRAEFLIALAAALRLTDAMRTFNTNNGARTLERYALQMTGEPPLHNVWCPRCRWCPLDSSPRCGTCGGDNVPWPTCSTCATSLSPLAKFCKNCGRQQGGGQ